MDQKDEIIRYLDQLNRLSKKTRRMGNSKSINLSFKVRKEMLALEEKISKLIDTIEKHQDWSETELVISKKRESTNYDETDFLSNSPEMA